MIKLVILTIILMAYNQAFAETSYALVDGPNCINNALYEAKLVPEHRYSSLSELKIFITSKYCNEIKPDQTYSDPLIGLIYSESKYANPDLVSHAFIRTDSVFAFEKKGYDKSEPYQTISLETIFEDYEINFPLKSVKYFKCLDFKTIVSQLKLSKEIKDRLNEILEMESHLALLLSLPQSETRAILMEKMIVSFCQKSLSTNGTDERFMAQIIASRIVSMANQLNALGYKKLRSVTYKYEFDTENIDLVFSEIKKINSLF